MSMWLRVPGGACAGDCETLSFVSLSRTHEQQAAGGQQGTRCRPTCRAHVVCEDFAPRVCKIVMRLPCTSRLEVSQALGCQRLRRHPAFGCLMPSESSTIWAKNSDSPIVRSPDLGVNHTVMLSSAVERLVGQSTSRERLNIVIVNACTSVRRTVAPQSDGVPLSGLSRGNN